MAHGRSPAAVPQFTRAGTFLEALTTQDFTRLSGDGRIAQLDLLCTGYRPGIPGT